MRRTPSILIASLAALLLAGAGTGPAAIYEVNSTSRFWIDGSATTGSYTCTSEKVSGTVKLERQRLGGRATIPVESFDCGISRMNRDFRGALRGDDFPAIRFELESARVLDEARGPHEWHRVQAVGTLTIAGSSQRVAIRAEGSELADGRVRVRGSHPLLMSDFGIDPPSGLLGLVRAHDRIVARFDIIASPR